VFGQSRVDLGTLLARVSKANAVVNMSMCVHVDVGLKGKPLVRYGVAPVSGILIEYQFVISGHPSLHTTNIAVDESPGHAELLTRPIVEGRPEGECSVLKHRMQGSGISMGPTSGEKRVFVSVDYALYGHDLFFEPISV